MEQIQRTIVDFFPTTIAEFETDDEVYAYLESGACRVSPFGDNFTSFSGSRISNQNIIPYINISLYLYMTQREEVRFKVYNKSSVNVTGSNTFPLELIDFLEGDGIYDTSTYKYNVQKRRDLFIGYIL